MIRPIAKSDRDEYLSLVKEFYQTDAVLHPIPDQYIEDAFDELLQSSVYAKAFIFEVEEQDNVKTAGYVMLAKSYSQEAGGLVIWIEEFYVRDKYRGKGLGKEFFAYMEEHLLHNVKRVRIEIEKSNKRAESLYKRMGFEALEYLQLARDKQ